MRTSMCGRPSGSETTGLTSGRMKARKKKKNRVAKFLTSMQLLQKKQTAESRWKEL